MEAVYVARYRQRGTGSLGSCYDVRALLDATSKMMDGKKITDVKLPLKYKMVEKKVAEHIEGTLIEEMLKRYHLL